MTERYSNFLEWMRLTIPNFDSIDRDPEFLKWVDTLGIDLRQVAADTDYKKAEHIYKTWNMKKKKEQAKKKKKPVVTWTPQTISKAYKDIQQGRYSPEQAMQIKQEIFQANQRR